MTRFIPLVPALFFLLPSLSHAEVIAETTVEPAPVEQSLDPLKEMASSDPLARDVLTILAMSNNREMEEAIENLKSAKEAAQSYVAYLQPAIRHPDATIRFRQRLIEALGDIRGEDAKKLIIEFLQFDPERDNRVRALGELHNWIKDDGIAQIITPLLDDADYKVQGAAYAALIKSGDIRILRV